MFRKKKIERKITSINKREAMSHGHIDTFFGHCLDCNKILSIMMQVDNKRKRKEMQKKTEQMFY